MDFPTISSGLGFLIGSVIISLTLIYVFSSNKDKWIYFFKIIFLVSLAQYIFRNLKKSFGYLKKTFAYLKKYKKGFIIFAILAIIIGAAYLIDQNEKNERFKKAELEYQKKERARIAENLKERLVQLAEKSKSKKRLEEARLKQQREMLLIGEPISIDNKIRPTKSNKLKYLPNRLVVKNIKYGMSKSDIEFRLGKLTRGPSIPVTKNDDLKLLETTKISLYHEKYDSNYYVHPNTLVFSNQGKLIGTHTICPLVVKANYFSSVFKTNLKYPTWTSFSCRDSADDLSKTLKNITKNRTIYCTSDSTKRLYRYKLLDVELIADFQASKIKQLLVMTEGYSINIPSDFLKCKAAQ